MSAARGVHLGSRAYGLNDVQVWGLRSALKWGLGWGLCDGVLDCVGGKL